MVNIQKIPNNNILFIKIIHNTDHNIPFDVAFNHSNRLTKKAQRFCDKYRGMPAIWGPFY